MAQNKSNNSIAERLKRVVSGGGGPKPRNNLDDDLRRINAFMAPIGVAALVAAGWVGWRADSVGPVVLWVFASFACGAGTGFLFGIPKSGLSAKPDVKVTDALVGGTASRTVAKVEKPEASAGARPNTNLEEVSDWLTKIIVGLTLVNLDSIKVEVQRISLNAAAAIRPKPTAADVSAATALVVGFAILGFLAMYLYMRLFVQGAIGRSDAGLAGYLDAVRQAEIAGENDPSGMPIIGPDGGPAEPVVPSAASLNAAQAVADAAPSEPSVVLLPLRQLAAKYETLRGQKNYSKERTRDMSEIVRDMRPHAIAAAPYIAELMRSPSTGEHLAATVILQMKYMPEHMDWLARRLVEERSFIGFQAASALLARMRVAGPPECKAICDAVRNAKNERARLNSVEPSLDKLIDQILEPQ